MITLVTNGMIDRSWNCDGKLKEIVSVYATININEQKKRDSFLWNRRNL